MPTRTRKLVCLRTGYPKVKSTINLQIPKIKKNCQRKSIIVTGMKQPTYKTENLDLSIWTIAIAVA